MAEVFLAHRVDDRLKTPIVVKRIRPELAGSDESLRRFVLEAQVASRLRHPNLVQFLEFGQVGDCHYIAMNFVAGFSLRRLVEGIVKRQSPPPLPVAIHIARGILDGLGAMHSLCDDEGQPRPMLHRDVTPANVIITDRGHPVVIDFGITKDVLGPAITIPGKVIGTTQFMSPEHRAAEFIDARADVFSAAVILWVLLTGEYPWPPLDPLKELLRTTFDAPEMPPALRGRMPQDLHRVALRGLACDRAERFNSAGEMSAAISACAVARELDAKGAGATRVWLASLSLETDQELETPVINHALPNREGAEPVTWNVLGRVDTPARAAELPRSVAADVRILDLPPLPPPRAATLDIGDEDKVFRAAIGRPKWVIALVVGCVIVAGVLGGVLLFHVHL